MSNERKALLIRLPEDLHEALRQLAAADLRSVNAEIEFLLREAVDRRRKRPGQASDAGTSSEDG